MPTSLPFVGPADIWSTVLSQGLLLLGIPPLRGAVVAALVAGVLSWLTRQRVSPRSA